MGEESKQAKQEEKKEEKAEEKPAKEEEPNPPSPVVLYVDLHCAGCAKKIEKSIMKVRGVEEVVIDMDKNEVTIQGAVEPQAICKNIMNMTKKNARVISPLHAGEGESTPEVANTQVSRLTTVELNLNMHCEACAEKLKKKILQMRGVHMVTAELSSGKVTVTGTMDAEKLVDYVYRRTRKQARIVPQPESEIFEKKEENKEAEKPAAQETADEEEEEKPAAEETADEQEEEKPAAEETADEQEEEKPAAVGEGEKKETNNENRQELDTKKMIYYYPVYHPIYVIERVPPPQLFSDENPNACCIS